MTSSCCSCAFYAFLAHAILPSPRDPTPLIADIRTDMPEDNVIRFDSQIPFSTWKRPGHNGHDIIHYPNVFEPDVEVYECATDYHCGVNLPAVLLVRADRFHQLHDIAAELHHLQGTQLPIAAFARAVHQEAGEGISIPARRGHHHVATSYLLVHRHSPTDWIAFANVGRRLGFQHDILSYELKRVTLWAKPLPNRRQLYGLLGASLGHLFGGEVGDIAGRIPEVTGLQLKLPCEHVTDRDERYGLAKLADSFTVLGLHDFGRCEQVSVSMGF